MQNTYQDLITEIQSKNPEIHQKLEGGQKFKLVTDFKPAGDQPEAIKKLVKGANKEELSQVLLGVTGSGITSLGESAQRDRSLTSGVFDKLFIGNKTLRRSFPARPTS